jgi:ATP/maltotriose-dependent transcriptional regulator MalT
MAYSPTMTNRDAGSTEALLEAGRNALSRGAWEEARTSLESVVLDHESAEALESLSWAAWWLNDVDVVFDARVRAYRRYRELGSTRGAARMALWLASDYLDFREEAAVANGWRERARRLLSGLDECPEHGWLALFEGALALEMDSDPVTGADRGVRATTIGVRLGLIDIQMLGLAVEGLALVTQGRVREGMRRLDEAVTAAISGELQDFVSITMASCYVIYACERVRDYDREAQWCRRVEELAERLRISQLLGECRTKYGAILTWQGAWREAERQLARAGEDFAESRPGAAAESIARLADLRRQQGRLDEAQQLFRKVEFLPLASLGRAHLALDRGDVERAVDLAERALRSLAREDRTGKAPWLDVLARGRAAMGDRAASVSAVEELRSIADMVATDPLRAAASFAEGIALAATGEHETAARRFDEAVDRFAQCGAPFETARSRIELARSLHATGRAEAAIEEATQAMRTLSDLGAKHELARATTLIREMAAPLVAPRASALGQSIITARQVGILRLVAEGLSDREIARRLVLSEHTVHRHVANILNRLGVPSRAAAVAQAKELGLL